MPAPMPRIAIVHEWLTELAGSEKVVEQMLRLYPNADLHALVDHIPDQHRGWLKGRKVETTWLQRIPASRRLFRSLLPLFPQTIERFDLGRYDLILSSHHCVAKGVLTKADQVHVSYVHSPMRYAWDLTHQYLGGTSAGCWMRRQAAWPMMHYLRSWDVISANRVDRFVANSQTVATRIWRCWRREATVVFPPVDTGFFTPGESGRADFWLHAGRLVPYKRADLAIRAFSQLSDQRLVVAGDGPELPRLRAMASKNVSFVGRPDGAGMRELLRRCRGLVFCAEEDFGILPVEAMACGAPVIAFGRGGATETVVHGKTGLLFQEQDADDVANAIRDAALTSWDHAAISAHAQSFGNERFLRQLEAETSAALADGRHRGASHPHHRNQRPIAIWTREHKSGEAAGRPRLIDALCDGPLLGAKHIRIPHAFEGGLWQISVACWSWLWRLSTFRPEPLQCALFASPAGINQALHRIGDQPPAIAYLDGVRCLSLARHLAARRTPFVVDLDDLMSRRCNLLLNAGERPNAGYLSRSLPSALLWAIERLGRQILRYERWALRRAEDEMVRLATATVLLSQAEVNELRVRVGPDLAGKIHHIPPEQRIVREGLAPCAPYRFIFVGGDALTQNRLALEMLTMLWRRHRPNSMLHWYGRRTSEGVIIPADFISHGYVEDLASEAYDGHSILLNPTTLAGGVKIKVLEALAHGCPVVGSPEAFEGLSWNDYPLIHKVDDEAWHSLLVDPERHADQLAKAVCVGQRHIAAEHSRTAFAEKWNSLLRNVPDGTL